MSPAAAIPRPGADEHLEYYARYIDLVRGDVSEALDASLAELLALVQGLDEATALRRYAPGKWSVKEVLGHLADGERVFMYRALRIARADATPLAGFDENEWVPAGRFDRLPLAQLVAEVRAVRASTRSLVSTLDEDALARRGTANGATISARALVWITAGHMLHHAAVLRDRYGLGAPAR